MCNDRDKHGGTRRSFLRAAGLAGAGAAALGAGAGGLLDSQPALAAINQKSLGGGSWNPDVESPRFTVAVMPDTQFLYFAPSIMPEPQLASFRYIVDQANGGNGNIVFMAHLGDLTEDGLATEFGPVGEVFDYLDQRGAAYSVLAGNHDVNSSTTDQRGSTPYLTTMGPQRFAKSKTFVGADSSGYNTAHVFQGGGREWLLLALDWRMSPEGFAWANGIIKQHPKLPVILTTHEVAGPTYDDSVYPYQSGDDEDNASLSAYGRQLWDGLINDNDQIFLTLNGHYWPPGRTVLTNAAGNDVHVHITNYQNRYFGGAAMIRLYHFDLDLNTIEVETIAPYFLEQPAEERNLLAAQLAELTTTVDRFSVPIDFAQRFSGFDPIAVRPARPAKEVLVPGTLAYWRFDAGRANGSSFTTTQTVPDLSGHGNDLSVLVTVPGSPANSLTWSSEFHPDQPGHGSLYFDGQQSPSLAGAYLTTATGAPLNTETFAGGYTFEVFVQVPTDWDSNSNSWMAALSRWGESGQAGKSAGNTDPNEPIATFSLSDGREPQWCVYPLNLDDESTNWGQALPEATWWHLAVVNDGKTTVMYVEGCPTVDNPPTIATGLVQLNLPWVLGGYEYGGTINQIWHGWIGDVRIVNRALSVGEFMIAGR
jgi:Concanavalin A-like lectin/glucanases superfamily/Calcineurin-like phosphoesterase